MNKLVAHPVRGITKSGAKLNAKVQGLFSDDDPVPILDTISDL